MSFSLPSYRVTEEDLVDADKKTKRGVEPLVSALNDCLARVIAALNSLALPTAKTAYFTTDSSGSASVALAGLNVTPKEVYLTYLQPAPTAVYSVGWTPAANGAAVVFFGLAASTTYTFTVRYS